MGSLAVGYVLDVAEDRQIAVHDEQPRDALELWDVQNRMLTDLFAKWQKDTDKLMQADSVDVRWERGSAVKLLMQHLAVREAAMQEIETVLDRRDQAELAARVDRDGVGRREKIARLDELLRGKVGMNANIPEVDEVIVGLSAIFRREVVDDPGLMRTVEETLGSEGRDDLPSARYVRTHSPTYTSPRPRWFDRVGPLKALRALYDHLRGSPSGVTTPGLDSMREQTPGLRADPDATHIEKHSQD